jgi:hypothetical protein
LLGPDLVILSSSTTIPNRIFGAATPPPRALVVTQSFSPVVAWWRGGHSFAASWILVLYHFRN